MFQWCALNVLVLNFLKNIRNAAYKWFSAIFRKKSVVRGFPKIEKIKKILIFLIDRKIRKNDFKTNIGGFWWKMNTQWGYEVR